MSLDYVSNQEIIQAARRNLPQDVWDYLTGGAESETTMRRNRLGFDTLALRPRVLVDVSKIDTSTTFLGQKLRIPVMMAPIGSLQSITPEGGVAVAKAAAEFGTMNFVSSVTQPSLEEIAASTNHPKIFQLYVRGGLDWCEEILGRVKKSGYHALCLTVDTAHYSRRERPLLNRWQPPSRRSETGSTLSSDVDLGNYEGDQKDRRLAVYFEGSGDGRRCQIGGRARSRRDLRFESRGKAVGSRQRYNRHASGNCRSGGWQGGYHPRRRRHPRHRRFKGTGARMQGCDHRETPGLGFGRGRSGRFDARLGAT